MGQAEFVDALQVLRAGAAFEQFELAGNQRIELEVAEQMKRERGESIWPVIRPVYEKMTDIVEHHIRGEDVTELWLAGGSCMQPGVQPLFQARFPHLNVVLPQQSIFMTPLAIAVCGVSQGEKHHAG